MAGYKKCPRCELNYIRDDQDMCDVCKAELKLGGIELLEDEDEEEELITCPICKENLISSSQKMCDECQEKLENGEIEISNTLEESWDDSDDIEVIEDEDELSLNQLVDDEFDEDEVDDEEE